MTATVLTCGQLRLSIPSGACMPSVHLRPSAAVEITFSNFSGTVLFETNPNITTPSNALLSPSVLLSASPFAPSQGLSTVQAIAASCALQSSHGLNPVPPLSHPPLLAHTPAPSSSRPISLSEPVSSPISPSVSRSFSHSDLSSSLTNYPATQLPHSSVPESVSDAQIQHDTPSIPHFETHFLPLSPPSSQDLGEAAPMPPTASQPESSQPESSQPDCSQPEPSQMKPPPEPMPTTPQKQKRPLLDACIIDYRPSKNGKRVRFEDDPVYVEAAPVCESASKVICEKRLSPSPWVPVVVSDDKVPERRWGATFTRVSSNSVVLLGGESESAGFFKDMCMLDIADNKWLSNGKDTPDMLGCGRAWHTTVSVDGANLFVFGGEMEVNGERTQTNSAVMYDTSYYTWYPPALSGPAPSARAGHCAAVVPGTKNVVIFGGINGNRWLSDVHLLEELNCWSKVRVSNKSVRPSARSYASLTPTTEYLVLFGGNNKTKCFNDVHIMLPDLTWTEPIILGRAPKARTGHSAITSKDGNNVIVYGGWDDQGAQRIFYSDIWMLRIKSQSECQWTCLFQGDNSSRAPGPRAGASFCAAAAQDEHILLFGGWHQLSYFNDISKLVLPSCSKKGAQPP